MIMDEQVFNAFFDELEKIGGAGYLKALAGLGRSHPMRVAAARAAGKPIQRVVHARGVAGAAARPVPGNRLMSAIQKAKAGTGPVKV